MKFHQGDSQKTGYEHVVEAHNDAARALLPEPASAIISHYVQRQSDVERLRVTRLLAESVPAILNEEIEIILACEDVEGQFTDLQLCAMAAKGELTRDDYHVSFLLPSYRGNLIATFDELGRVDVKAADFKVDFEGRRNIAHIYDCWTMDRDDISLAPPSAKITDDLETLRQAFWTKVNPKFEDQWLDGEEDAFFAEQEDPEFTSGSRDDLTAVTMMLVAAWFGKDGRVDAKAEVSFPANVPEPLPASATSRNSKLVRSDCSGLDGAPESLWAALMKGHAENQFTGWIIDYNDGRHNRQSGYDHDRTFLTVTIDPEAMSAHERIELYSHTSNARTWLQARGFNNDQIAEICGPE